MWPRLFDRGRPLGRTGVIKYLEASMWPRLFDRGRTTAPVGVVQYVTRFNVAAVV